MEIFRFLGIIMLLIGLSSGVALFFLAVSGSDRLSKSKSTLWGLFLIGLVAGIIMVSISI